jgi:hypothetical protein
MHRCIDAWIDA